MGLQSLAELILNVLWSSGLQFLDSELLSRQKGAGANQGTLRCQITKEKFFSVAAVLASAAHMLELNVAALCGKQFQWCQWTCSEKRIVTLEATVLLPKGSFLYVLVETFKRVLPSFFIFTGDCITHTILNFLF